MKPLTIDEFANRAAAELIGEYGSRAMECALYGLAGESGEVVDEFKKVEFSGKPYSKEKVIEKVSDTLWYLLAVAAIMDITVDQLIEYNQQKLAKRYPERK
jgi:NTP pyrophosphatase (non-canonical NTP hydrolase)